MEEAGRTTGEAEEGEAVNGEVEAIGEEAEVTTAAEEGATIKEVGTSRNGRGKHGYRRSEKRWR